jgi:hypothetical protein
VKGKMWRVLRNIYSKVESAVLLGNSRTNWFEIEVGLRQGCLLSPLLFDIFLDDLVREINSLEKGVKCGNKRLSILLFADDIAILAESKEDLQLMLDKLFEYDGGLSSIWKSVEFLFLIIRSTTRLFTEIVIRNVLVATTGLSVVA